jgi:predicted adenylyl cyclase CyaB
MTVPADFTPPRRNLELKVRLPAKGLAAVRARIEALGVAVERLCQHDRYFTVPEGRLKLRTISYDTESSRAELIAYRRPDTDGSRWSSYRIAPLDPAEVAPLAAALEHVMPVLVEVRKRRDVAMLGATRIHLDVVEELGAFVELETVIGEQADNEAEREHREVIERLGLDAWPAEAGSYSDLLRRVGRDAPAAGTQGR